MLGIEVVFYWVLRILVCFLMVFCGDFVVICLAGVMF
jgi:hypothetical protein